MACQFLPRALALVLALLGALALTVPAGAKPLTEAERTGLTVAVQSFKAAFDKADFAVIIRVLPPKVLQHFTKISGLSEEQFARKVGDVMASVMTEADLVSFDMDIDAADAQARPDGTRYVLVPTRSVLRLKTGQTAVVRSHTLAITENGQWYLMRISDLPQVKVLVEVYPEFKSVTLPGDTTEFLKD